MSNPCPAQVRIARDFGAWDRADPPSCRSKDGAPLVCRWCDEPMPPSRGHDEDAAIKTAGLSEALRGAEVDGIVRTVTTTDHVGTRRQLTIGVTVDESRHAEAFLALRELCRVG